MSKSIAIFSLFFVCLFAHKEDDLNVKSLSKVVLEFEEISINYPDSDFLQIPVHIGDSPSMNTVDEMRAILINKDFNLIHKVNKPSLERRELFNKEYLLFGNYQVDIDSLFKNSVGEKLNNRCFLIVESGNLFQISNKKYLLLELSYRIHLMRSLPIFWILFDITDTTNINYFAFYSAIPRDEYSKYCFSDFDSDGQIDYIEFRDKLLYKKMMGKLSAKDNLDTAKVYSLVNNSFVGNSEKFITFRLRNIRREYADAYIIERKKSNWFFAL